MIGFFLRQLGRPWAAAALICLLVYILLFALAGETVNAPFIYTPPP
jgi:hypothetical protein